MSTPKSTNMRLRLLLCLLAFFAITVTSAAKGNYQEVSASGKFFMVLKTDETLWAWGWNYLGQLGDGTTTDRHTPVKIMDNVRQVSAGECHTLAIRNDDTLWAWGWNYLGQLGDGTTTDRYTPVKIADRVKTVSCGWDISIYITEEGDLMITGKMNKK